MRSYRIPGQFAWQTIEMLESPAYAVLSLSGRRLIDRIQIELAHHAGYDNGRLPVTYSQFEEYGIERHAIAPAIREAVALGFIEVTERGRAGNCEFRTPNLFRLTFREISVNSAGKKKPIGPTDEWRRITGSVEAKRIARVARAQQSAQRP